MSHLPSHHTTGTSTSSSSRPKTRDLSDSERVLWQRAGQIWLDELFLRDPFMIETSEEEAAYYAQESLASINALTFETNLNLKHMRSLHVDEFLFTFMAHEIGHHAVAPAGLTNQMRYLAAARQVSMDKNKLPGYVNIALDLLINTILVTQHNLPCPEIYKRICKNQPIESFSFGLMLGAMERLWNCEPMFVGFTQSFEKYNVFSEALCAIYELHGEGRRGADLIPYVTLACRLLANADSEHPSPQNSQPQSLDNLVAATPEDADELRKWLRSGGMMSMDNAAEQAKRILAKQSKASLTGSKSPTFPDYSPRLASDMINGTAAGMIISPTEIIINYYESMANAHLVSFTADRGGHSELYPESLKEWSLGDPIEEIDWLQSSIRSGHPIPGVNTVAWEYGSDPEPLGAEPFPIDLDIYVDTSGSMPDPHRSMSHIALGAFIFALSVLRQGGAVRVTIWSYDERNLLSTNTFSTSKETVLSTLCHSIRGGTQFPVKHWETALNSHQDRSNVVHTVILSDDGIDTWFQNPRIYPLEQVTSILARVQNEFKGGGTVILNGNASSVGYNLPEDWSVFGCRTWQDVVNACADVATRKFTQKINS